MGLPTVDKFSNFNYLDLHNPSQVYPDANLSQEFPHMHSKGSLLGNDPQIHIQSLVPHNTVFVQ